MDNIADELYKNFLLLSVGIHLFANPALCHHFCDYDQDLLDMFVQHFTQIYGTVLYKMSTAWFIYLKIFNDMARLTKSVLSILKIFLVT